MKPPSHPFGATRQQRGAVLLVVIFLAAIAAITLLLSQLNAVSQKAAQQGVAASTQSLAKNALLGYVRTNGGPEFWGLLPLPDMGIRAASHVEGESPANFTGNSADALLIGRLPYKTLGTAPRRDDSQNCLWYAVSAAFKTTNTNVASGIYVPTFNWDTLGDFETGRSNDPHESRAVALVFGPGMPTASQSRAPGPAGESVTECGGNYRVSDYLESLAAIAPHATSDGNQAIYVLPPAQSSPTSPPAAAIALTPQTESRGSDDRVLAITSSEIFQQVLATGRVQAEINTLLPLLRTCLIDANLPPNGLTPISSATPTQRRYVGPLPPATDCLPSYQHRIGSDLALQASVYQAAYDAAYDKAIAANDSASVAAGKAVVAGNKAVAAWPATVRATQERWRDNLWLLVCETPEADCIKLTDTTPATPPPVSAAEPSPQDCDGALVFAGHRTAGQRRATSADKNNPDQYLEADSSKGTPAAANAFKTTDPAIGGRREMSALPADPAQRQAFLDDLKTGLSDDIVLCLKRPTASAKVEIDNFVDVTPVLDGKTLVRRDPVADIITLGNFGVATTNLGGASAVGATFSGPLTGLVVAATANTVTLSANASTAANAYAGAPVVVRDSEGNRVQYLITEYDGPSRTATVDRPWSTIPQTATPFEIDLGMLPFGKGIRVYFRAKIKQSGVTFEPGPGFVFALFDADQNLDGDDIPTARVSGGSGPNGQYLGYAGRNFDAAGKLFAPPIEYPKIGLEFDTLESPGTNDTTYHHLALVYWGYSHDSPVALSSLYDDDNTHRVPTKTPAQTGYIDPYNASAYGYPPLRDALESNRDFHVRLEIDRDYRAGAGVGSYVSRIWIVKAVDGMIPGMDNLEQDFSTLTSIRPPHTQTIEMTDLVSGAEAFKRFRYGFTNAQSARRQQVTIQDLKLRLRAN